MCRDMEQCRGVQRRLQEKLMRILCRDYYAPAFDPNMFKKAVENFRSGSTGNQDGKYGRGAPVPVTQNPLIKSLFPLLKY